VFTTRSRSASPTPSPRARNSRWPTTAGSLAHLTCLFFFQLAGAEPTYVVYRGFGQTINDILSGSIDGICELIASARAYVVSGSVKGFGVAAVERTPLLPDVPTSKEGGNASIRR